uniref:Fibrinogen C-terminal domain-containing protein n=1 Tax=Coturnix japonica TaxID=93934 RepID=A0A8C2SUP1_COTJA
MKQVRKSLKSHLGKPRGFVLIIGPLQGFYNDQISKPFMQVASESRLAFPCMVIHHQQATWDSLQRLQPGQDVTSTFPAAGWPKDCSELPPGSHSGVYIIQPKGLHQLVVYCEMNTTSGGWTVIQRNQRDTPVTWAESWSTYKYGFGNVRSEYWLGTEYIHQIAKQKVYQVRFVISDNANNIKFADYNLFSVEDEAHGYRLRLGSYSGTAGDAMTSDNPSTMHDNMKFSTKDRDQDNYSRNCAYSYEGGWWFSSCYSVRLNFKGGMTWGSLCKGDCKSSLILIKPALYC